MYVCVGAQGCVYVCVEAQGCVRTEKDITENRKRRGTEKRPVEKEG